jgi:hypothetical protein
VLRLVEENTRALHKEYEAFVRGSCDEVIHGRMAHPGRQPFAGILYWFESPGIWVSFRQPGRYWNGYGFSKPRGTSPVGIDFEINYAFHGINPALGAALARDDQDTICLVHRGKFTGKRGLTKERSLEFFEQRFPERLVVALEQGSPTKFILVARLVGGLNDIADFGRAVVVLKQTVGRRS